MFIFDITYKLLIGRLFIDVKLAAEKSPLAFVRKRAITPRLFRCPPLVSLLGVVVPPTSRSIAGMTQMLRGRHGF
jgi:hypothetical protein